MMRPTLRASLFVLVLLPSLLLAQNARVLPAPTWDASADTIITGASIVTMGPSPRAEAMAIRQGKIIGVGTAAELARLRGPRTVVIQATGKTIVPGLQDSHIHPLSLGRDAQLQTDLLNSRSVSDVVGAVRELKAKWKPADGRWLTAARWDAPSINPSVTRWDLDAVTPVNPLYLQGARRLAVNTAALELMGIQDDDPKTWPDWWLKDPANFTAEDVIQRATRRLTIAGETRAFDVPTGVFIGTLASRLVTVRPPASTVEEDVASVDLGTSALLRFGITSVIDAGNRFNRNNRVYQLARDRGLLRVKIPASYLGIFRTETPEQVKAITEGLQVSNLGDGWLRMRGAKIYGDGGLSARGSWVSQPYVSTPNQAQPGFGTPVERDYAKREALYRGLLEYGFDLHSQAIGDAAMLQVVRLYKKLQDEILTKNPRADLRWTIEHANFPLEQAEVIDTMATYRIVASIQPVMISELGRAWALNVGKDRMARAMPAGSYLKKGVTVVSGSDYEFASVDPWLGIYSLLTRRDQYTGEVYGPSERVSLDDALKTYTTNGAYVTHEEEIRGSLEVGKVADFVVLDIPDLSDAQRNPDLLKTMSSRVLATVIDGVVRYQRPGAAIFK